jgi:hypothetical protein
MFESLKRLFTQQTSDLHHDDVSGWARQTGRVFKKIKGTDHGFAMDGAFDKMPWRLEWGPPQREYLQGPELRMRMELALPPDMQMLVLSRSLIDVFEKLMYENFTDGTQTETGDAAPEEIRWVVMFQKVDLASLTLLRTRYAAVASVPEAALAWLQGPLAQGLETCAQQLLLDDAPFLLMTLRGRLYLRMRLNQPDWRLIQAALAIFELAAAQALRAAAGFAGPVGEWQPTSSTAWQSLQSDELPRKKTTRA